MTSINVRCWAPLRSALVALPLFLLLPALSNLHQPPPAYVWRFKVRETYYQNGKQVTRQVGSQDCPLVGCQTRIRITVDIQSVYHGVRPYACFAYDQEDPDRCNQEVDIYGGCRWNNCVVNDAYNGGSFIWNNGAFHIIIRDPWDQRWVTGVVGKLYLSGWNSTPSGTLTKLSEELHAGHFQDNSPFSWSQSPLATWVLPMIGPLILICVFFLLAPCLLKFIRSRIAEMSRVTVNQLLLHPYTRLPSDLPLPNPGL